MKRRITNVAAGSDANDAATVGQLEKVAAQKGSWQLTAGGANKSTIDGDHNTVDFSAGSDGNLSVSKTADTNNVTIGLKKDVTLGKATYGNGGSLSIYQYTGDSNKNDKENGYDQLGTHTLLDGSTISVRYNNGSTDSDARGVVLGVAKDALLDKNNKETATSPLGYVYLTDNGKYYYIHGTTLEDAKDHKELAGRLVYESEVRGYNYIADLDDGLKVTGDTAGTTVTTSLNPEAKNNTLSITGGERDSSKLTTGNIGVVATAATDTAGGNLNIRLAKDLTGITSISNQTTSGTTTTGAKIELGSNGTTISGGDVDVSKNKITNLKNGEADTDAATVGQMNTAIGNAKTKYYSVHEGPQIAGFSTNEKNDGASASAGLAAGYETGTAGIGSTVVGSYSGVMNEGTGAVIDLRGAASLSLGTLNLNQSTNATVTGNNTKPYSGVANSIIGQGNMTTDSNAALIFGAGNTVSDSYRNVDINTSTMKGSTPSDLESALQTAVPKSGAQVMVMGGGNKITSAYMTQVIGVGNTVTGSDTTYAEKTSTQYNYVDGSNNTLTKGKGDYIIGANNSVTGTSIDKNQSNIVVGDNHTLTNQKNNVVLGSADSQKELKASDAVVIGHNADVQKDDGVAIGSESVASIDKDVAGYDPETGKASTTWKSTNAAVSVGKADGSLTRQITGVAAGTNDTDAVNVAQIKKLASINASNIGANLKKADGTAAEAADVTKNKEAWATAIGTGTVTKDDDGSKQLVTGGTVYTETHPTANGNYIQAADSAATNLSTLDTHVKANADKLSDMDNSSVKYDTKTVGDKTTVDKTKITLAGGTTGTTITNVKSALNGAADISKVTEGLTNAVNLSDLQTAYNTLDKKAKNAHTALTVENGTKANEEAGQYAGKNIQLHRDTDANGKVTYDVKLAKDLTGITSISGGTDDNGAKITLDEKDKNISVNGGQITSVASGNGSTTTSKYSGNDATNAANIGDVHNIVDDKVAGVTYTYGDGLKVDGKTISVKAGNGITVDKNGVSVKTGKHLNISATDGNVDVDDSGEVKENNANLVTGGTVYTETHAAKTDSNGQAVKYDYIDADATAGENFAKLDTAMKTMDTKAGAHTVVTVEGGTSANGEKDQYAGKNIQLHSDTDATTGKVTYDVKLAKDLTGITSISNQTTTGDKTTGAKITLNTDGSTDFNGGKITNIASNATKGADGKYTVADADKNNAASMSDVQNLIKDATDAANTGLAGKANITADNIGANLKDDKGNKASGDEIRTNENDWGKAIGTGVIADPTKTDKNDPEKNGSEQLVTGGTVYKALNGGLTKIVIGTPGEPGKDGAPGTIGLVGPAGTNGKDGAVDITIQKGKDDDAKGIKGANGVDGKDGITRIVYTDAAGDHQAATMEDGMKFAGDDGQTSADKVIAKKLNNTIDIIGGADSKKLTDKNIGVNNVGGKLKIQLAQNLTGITSIGNQKTTGEGKDATTTGAKITLDDNDKNISVNGGSIKEVASNLKDGKLIDGSADNAASISDVQTLVQQGVDNGYTNGDGITIQKDSTSGKNVISVNKGDGLKFNDNHELVVNTGDGLEIADGAVKIKAADNNFKISSNGIGLSDIVTIGTNKSTQVTIDGTKGEISGLSNTTWGKPADYSNSTKAATESQVAQAMSAAIDQAGQNDVDTHVEAGTYAVGTITTDDGKTEQGVSLAIVDKSGKTTNTKVVITDVAKASDVGDVSKLADGVKNADGSTTTVVNAINNVNTKIGDQKYSTSNTSGSNKYVNDGDSITSAIGKLDGAVQNAAEQAGKHSIVSVAEGEKNISVKNIAKEGEAANYQISLNKDLNVTSVTATTVTTDTLNANSATIGGDKGITIKDNTVSGLKDTEIKEGSTNAVNGNTIWKELRPTADGSYIKKDSTTAQNLKNLDTQVKKTADLINSDGKTIKIGGSDSATKIDVSDKDGNGRTITGVVTDGSDNSSAANVGYVNEVAAANTQQIYRDMNSAYGHLNNNINKAAAGSNALAALHPLDYDPADKASYAVGYGHYRNANAAAVGAFYQPNANTMVSVGVSMGNGDPGVNAGVSFKVGKGSAYNGVSKAQMAETIAAQEKQISEIKASDVAKDQRIDSLEKENQEMKKQIQEILAKLGK